MNTIQGKNVVVVGGLQGVGLKLTKNLLRKNIKNLYIIDIHESGAVLNDLKSQCQTTKLFFKRIDEFKFNTEIQKTVQDITLKMDKIDVFINTLELLMEKDLQRTMDTNMKIYLTTMMAARNVMDRNKGGRGGKIVNVLSNMGLKNLELRKYGCDTDCFDQQFLINKQMLLSLTEAFGQDEFFQQTGVAVLTVMPVLDKNLVRRNYDWIKKIGLEKLVNDLSTFNSFDNDKWMKTNFELDCFNDDDGFFRNGNDQDWQHFTGRQNKMDTFYGDGDDCNQGQYFHGGQAFYGNNDLLDGNTSNINHMLNVLCDNMVRGIERGQNGTKIIAGIKGIKKIEKQGYNLSRL